MITGRELTPKERGKLFRSYRFSAISNLVFGVAITGLAIYEIAVGRRGWYSDWSLVLGPLWLVLSGVAWSRARKYR